MRADHPLKAVTLAHVRYQRGDQLGHFLAWVSLVPVFISLGGFVSHFCFRRELQGMFFGLGLLISHFINELIKKSVQQARPEACALLEMCDSHVTTKWAALFLPWSSAVLTMYSRFLLELLWGLFLLGFGFPLIEESALGRFFYVKDTSHISDVLKFEYDNARAARKGMAARKVMASKNS
ncbi:hypothetical protein Gorai_013643 [Gossypium raimondii]|uniref:Uncharacterized protein n=1 Tax=Gossypium raimondii TaxID=29730 RepID=A0A7J8Q6B0_GOSRA|nr:hypothetical protein [Gossypium raimondii]